MYCNKCTVKLHCLFTHLRVRDVETGEEGLVIETVTETYNISS